MPPPTTARISAHLPPWRPPVPNPVDVLTKSAPAFFAASEPRTFSSVVSSDVSRITLQMAAAAMAGLGYAANIRLHRVGQAGFQRANIDHHVDFLRAQLDGLLPFRNFHLRKRGAQRKTHYRANLHFAAANQLRRLRTFQGFTHTEAKPNFTASAQILRISSRVASGFSSV